ncbi:hypothetical protein NDU88_005497 [Pleurodeles waltl]|uniref:Uncharacterized protein n=1 Tax=Pleurodeles waltl TaxID=8319 RepID=A0AAV7M9G7_PLEWA|nr:hypothetical protein NDU88_005497 [Pleurodeles waltl]
MCHTRASDICVTHCCRLKAASDPGLLPQPMPGLQLPPLTTTIPARHGRTQRIFQCRSEEGPPSQASLPGVPDSRPPEAVVQLASEKELHRSRRYNPHLWIGIAGSGSAVQGF